MHKLAAEANVSIGTVHKDIDLLQRCPAPSHGATETDLGRETHAPSHLAEASSGHCETLFGQGELHCGHGSGNARSDRYLTPSASEVPPVKQSKHTGSVMVLGVIASNAAP